MTPLATENILKESKLIIKEWIESYRQVRERKVPSETTKHKAGVLPPAVYDHVKPATWSTIYFTDTCGSM